MTLHPCGSMAMGVALFAACACGLAGAEQRLPTEDKILILGDSITYADGVCGYVEDLEVAFYTRFPARHMQFIDVGLPSENLSGLSEPGHANGAYSRPCLFDIVDSASKLTRLDSVLGKIHPQLVMACYGMNDGIYLPFDQGRFDAFKAGMTRLHDTVVKSGARMLHLTPTVYDNDGPYGAVIETYAAWLLDQRQQGWDVVDVHGPMKQALAALKAQQVGFKFASDGVHPGDLGHLLIAQQVLEYWGFPAEVDHAAIDAKARTASAGAVSELTGTGDELTFTWRTSLPLPLPQEWDGRVLALLETVGKFSRHRLVVTGLTQPRYELREGDALVGAFTNEEFSEGIELSRLSALSSCRSSLAALDLERGPDGLRKVTTYGWLTETRYTGRAMPAWPLADAVASAAGKDQAIRALCAGVTLKLRLVPAAAAKDAGKADAPAAAPVFTDLFDGIDTWSAQATWTGNPSPTAAATVEAGAARFTVPEPHKAMVWTRALPLAVTGAQVVTLRYRAQHLNTAAHNVIISLQGAHDAQALKASQLTQDGEWHVLTVPITAGGDAASEFKNLTLAVEADDWGNGTLTIDSLAVGTP